ncbi:MAG: right-handed parallel beta-helix repeat-containing protein [Planctomycetota bacterium]
MRIRSLSLLLVVASVLTACPPPKQIEVTPETFDQALVNKLADGSVLMLAPGRYRLEPVPYEEFTAGASEDDPYLVRTTYGLRIRGKDIHIRGSGADSTFLHTNAGYGVLFEDAQECSLSALTVTGGKRTEGGGRIPEAAVVVKGDSLVFIQDCEIADNLGDEEIVEETVSGIMGINVRDGGSAVIRDNRIVRNSWDGIACYWDSHAIIENNVIDGGEANGRGHGGGRGVGIGITLNPYAEVRGNYVARYWKGIGVFVSPTAIVEENVVEDMLTWGLTVWNADHGAPQAVMERNIVHHTGACGASITLQDRNSSGSFRDNLIVRSGRDARYDGAETYCLQLPVAVQGTVEGFVIEGNIGHDNRTPDDRPGPDDVDEETYRARLAELALLRAKWPALGSARVFGDL